MDANEVTKVPKRIVFIVNQLAPFHSDGAGTYNRGLLNACKRLGHDVTVICCARQLPGLWFQGEPGIRFIHAGSLFEGRYILNGWASLARYAYKQIKRYAPKKNGPATSVSIGYFPTEAEIREATRLLKGINPTHVFVDTIFRDRFLAAQIPGRRVLIAHDVFSERTRSFEASGRVVNPAISAEMEKRIVSSYDAIIAINADEARLLKEMAPERQVLTVFPSVDARKTIDLSGSGILYIGSSAHHNVEGLEWFLSDIWPRVRQARGDVKLHVAGSICSVIGDHEGVIRHGVVKDMNNLRKDVSFAINPIRVGSGLKIKMVDYFAMGLGCITTSVGAQGFPTADIPFAVEDDAQGFAGRIDEWLEDKAVAEQMGKRAKTYVGHFSSGAIDAALSPIFDGA